GTELRRLTPWLDALDVLLEQLGQRAAMAGIDLNRDAHAGPQLKLFRLRIDADPHRNALADLDPVAARVLRRQDREFRTGSWSDARHGAGPDMAGIAIDPDFRPVAGLHMG